MLLHNKRPNISWQGKSLPEWSTIHCLFVILASQTQIVSTYLQNTLAYWAKGKWERSKFCKIWLMFDTPSMNIKSKRKLKRTCSIIFQTQSGATTFGKMTLSWMTLDRILCHASYTVLLRSFLLIGVMVSDNLPSDSLLNVILLNVVSVECRGAKKMMESFFFLSR